MHLPDAIVRHVTGSPDGTATIAANRISSGVAKPVVVIIANELAIVAMSEAFKLAIETARAKGDNDNAEGWKGCILQILAAYDGVDPERRA